MLLCPPGVPKSFVGSNQAPLKTECRIFVPILQPEFLSKEGPSKWVSAESCKYNFIYSLRSG